MSILYRPNLYGKWTFPTRDRFSTRKLSSTGKEPSDELGIIVFMNSIFVLEFFLTYYTNDNNIIMY